MRPHAYILPALMLFSVPAAGDVVSASAEVVEGLKTGLSIAKKALRDGLWEVARRHALTDGSEEAKLIVLESYALEGKWDEIEKSLSLWGDKASGDGFDYYRALIAGDLDRALKLLRKATSGGATSEALMLEAEIMVRKGDRKKAESLWREVVSSTNSSDRAFVVAAVNLGEAGYLSKARDRAPTTALRELASVRLGAALLDDPHTVTNGERIVRAVVKASPDTSGAKEAFFKLGRVKAESGDWSAASAVWSDMMEIWPASARSAEVQQCRGEAFFRLGRLDDALGAFVNAEEFAKKDRSSKAAAVLRQGDVLARLGRNDEAMVLYKKVISECPDTDIAGKLRRVVEIMELEAKGRGFFKGYSFLEAQKAFASVAAADPRRKSRMEYFEVLCLYGQGNDVAALSKARELSASCPDEAVKADATLWLAKLKFNRGEWGEALSLFESYVSLAPASPSAAEALGWAARAAFADGDYKRAINISTAVVEKYPSSSAVMPALIVQGEALIELARYAEALLVLERVSAAEDTDQADRLHARLLIADSLFALGADNPGRYEAALRSYRALRFGGLLDASAMIGVSFRIGRTLEKLKRYDEAVEQYYTHVVLAYRDGRSTGIVFDDSAKAAFSRAAFRLADEFESHGKEFQAMSVLRLVSTSDVPAAAEAARRLERISNKGRFL